MSIAQTILAQLGGGRFQAMTGARHFIDTGKGLTFQVPMTTTRNRCNAVRITLENDLYEVEFIRMSKFSAKTLSKFENVYADRLQSIFTDQTGLDTHL